MHRPETPKIHGCAVTSPTRNEPTTINVTMDFVSSGNASRPLGESPALPAAQSSGRQSTFILSHATLCVRLSGQNFGNVTNHSYRGLEGLGRYALKEKVQFIELCAPSTSDSLSLLFRQLLKGLCSSNAASHY